MRGPRRPRYVGSGEGPDDLDRLAERHLREVVSALRVVADTGPLSRRRAVVTARITSPPRS